MIELRLPHLGEGIQAGEILKWYVEVGQQVAKDDPLVDLEIDKAAITLPAPVAGCIKSLAAKVGDSISVGGLLAIIDDGLAIHETVAAVRPPEVALAASVIPFFNIEPIPDFSQWGTVRREPLRSIRRRVALKLVTAKILIPHVAHMDEADVTLLEDFRNREQVRRKGQVGEHLTLLAFVIKAVTAGLKEAPAFNASLDPFAEEIIYKDYFNIGVAVDTGRGLVVPVVKNTDRKSIIQIASDIDELATKAREGKLSADELHGGNFSITNVGSLGGTNIIPAINYPEVAILGMGRAQEKPVVKEGKIVVRTMLPLTLAYDHRVADGADAARFVTELVRQLSDPHLLLLES